MRRLLLLLILCGTLANGQAAAEPATIYRGEQTLFADTVWSGEILIDGILTVAPGVTLEIRPGTRVLFTRMDSNGDGVGEHELFSQGTILALGTAAAPIVFTSAQPTPQRGDWGALNMMVGEADNRLEHCRIEYGYRGFHAHFSQASLRAVELRDNLRGAQFQESRVVIVGGRFIDNTNGIQFRDSQVELTACLVAGNQWGIRCVYSDVILRDCEIRDNLINGLNLRGGSLLAEGNRLVGNRRGLYLQESRGSVRGNLLADNSEHGIFLENSTVEVSDNRIVANGRAGIRWLNSAGRLFANQIDSNGVYALINDGDGPVDARGNWWGSADPALIALTVRDGRNRPGMGLVDTSAPLPAAPDISTIPEYR
ncbi:MAG: right-handed parallel beta-helix repeat-containing protein [Desulfuromonadales bacterium]|nr:right-handed parallel beta-helix repeat-containing protein [Desulfuromonadales bacterium]